MAPIPQVVKIKQSFPRPVIGRIPETVSRELDGIQLAGRIKPGNVVAITAGSRGISNILLILQQVVNYVKAQGAVPIVISAMGSHGGGTAEGQKEVLNFLGINEQNMGCRVVASSEVIKLGNIPGSDVSVFCAKEAVEADGVIVVNRVKAHTAFHAQRESGLIKMMGIGLGRALGAKAIHFQGVLDMGRVILEFSRVVRQRINLLAGLAIVENGYEETALIKGILPDDIEREEAEILKFSKSILPRIPFDSLDLLIVDEMGKNFSGTGMDTNVIGRWRIQGIPEPESPQFSKVVVLDLSAESKGNATGIGLADFTTRKLVDKIDFNVTYLNCLTSGFTQRAMIPITLDSDKQAVKTALDTICLKQNHPVRMVRIKNTLFLDEMYCSEGLIPEIKDNINLEICKGLHEMEFDSYDEVCIEKDRD